MPSLTDQGFVPKAAARRIGTSHHVVFERTTPARPMGEWRLIEFETIETLDAALAAAAADGFQARVMVRPAFRSWPGLSETGMVLAVKVPAGLARESRVLVGRNRELKDVAEPLRAATADGWMLDLMFTSARDGSLDARRERLVLALSRDRSARSNGSAGTIERHTSFGIFGSGVPAGGSLFWTDYVFAWTSAARRQIWASRVQLSDAQENCLGLKLKMRVDATNDELNTIVALLAKPRSTGGFEMVVVTER